jgi:hypothetical protein
MTRAAIDDMMGKYERTSEAYLAGVLIGADRMRRKLRAEVEKMIWQSERSAGKKEETAFLTEVLTAMDQIKTSAVTSE